MLRRSVASCRRMDDVGATKLSDSRTALPLPACHQGVYARRSLSSGRPKAGPVGRAMERSEFARSSRKFLVRGPLREFELRGKAPSPTRVRPCGEPPLTPTLIGARLSMRSSDRVVFFDAAAAHRCGDVSG